MPSEIKNVASIKRWNGYSFTFFSAEEGIYRILFKIQG